MATTLYRQSGITFWGLCFVLFFIGVLVLFTLRAFPLYNEKFQVLSAIDSVVSRPDASKLSDADVRKYFMRNIQVTNIDRFNDRNIRDHVTVIKPKNKREPRIMHVQYEARNDLFSDLDLILVFDVKKPLRGPSEGE